MPEQVDYYRVLHVSRQATLVEIKKAFRRLARQFHPDLNPNDRTAVAYFQQISSAYKVLSDRQRRAKYDALLSPEPVANPRNVQAGYQPAYQRGLDQLALRDYSGAIAAFDQAIVLNPESTEAYLGRCRANEELKNDRTILDDCYRLLQLDPQLSQAYYHQGRARFRLGYLQGAAESYTHAIVLQDTFALAYYQRGRILLEMGESDRACQDLQKASQLFRVQNDLEQYRQAEGLLNSLRPYRQRAKINLGNGLFIFFTEALTSIPSLLRNPSVYLQATFTKLGSPRAAWTGLLYGLITAGSIAGSTALLAFLEYSWPRSNLYCGTVAAVLLYSTLTVTGAIAHSFVKGRLRWSESFFLIGVAALPIALLFISISLILLPGRSQWLSWIWVPLTVFAGCYSVIILYVGYVHLSKMAESVAMVVVSLSLTSTAIAAVVSALLYLAFLD